MKGTAFTGFSPDTYRFLMEIRFNNNREFFEENRARYERVLKQPMQAMAATLLPAALAVDGEFDQRIGCIVSRIRRDTRFSKDKSLYRDHAWLGFRRPGRRISEGMTMYFEITPDNYGYGIGMYAADPSLMKEYRSKILARPSKFLELERRLEKAGFLLEGESFCRDRFPEANPQVKPFLNRKRLSWCYECEKLENTMDIALLDEVRHALALMGPLYQFLHGMD